MSEKQAKPPLLFISNPIQSEPEAKAQKQYYSLEETFSSKSESESHATDATSKRRKFHDMTIDEKLKYMTDMPVIMPKMKCEVITSNQIYVGTVEQCDDEQLVIRTVEQGFKVNMKRENIKDVRLKGF
ncbi:CotO family spore coat protein [Alkalibacillus sp. S2W]|uniref:CotO family spore coat protein n=1 Tax=Alkalibacillus sp. S2W TaxID=3386553 RepID=UPI00398C90EE